MPKGQGAGFLFRALLAYWLSGVFRLSPDTLLRYDGVPTPWAGGLAMPCDPSPPFDPLLAAAGEVERHVHPELDGRSYCEQLALLHDGLAMAGVADAADPQAALRDYFYGELGFAAAQRRCAGPSAGLLHHVVANRRGNPVTLAVLYRALAAAAGIAYEAVDLPGLFMLRRGRVYLDAYHDARRLSWPQVRGYLSRRFPDTALPVSVPPATTDVGILLRLCRDLLGPLHVADRGRAVTLQGEITRLAGGRPDESVLLAVMLLEDARPAAAERLLRTVIAEHPAYADGHHVHELLAAARRQTTMVN